MLLNDVKIVLCRASEAGNVGAICRVMKNMGLSHLRLADSETLETEKILTRAVNAADVWESAEHFSGLKEAVADCSIVVGTTRRRGHNRKSISMSPHVLAEFLSERPGPAAIVFGNERTGLDKTELNLCNFASHIPVSDAQPSLNLSHAVQVYAYELFLAMESAAKNHVKGEWNAMNQSEISELVNSITEILESVGFYKKPNKEMQARFLRDIISRAGMSQSEGCYLKEIFSKAARLNKKNS